MKFFMFLGFLGHTLGCLPGFSRIFTNKFKDLTKKKMRNPIDILLSKHPKLKSSLEKAAIQPLKEKSI